MARRSDTTIVLIGIFKLVKAVLLVVLATGALTLRTHDVTGFIRQLARTVHADPDSRWVDWAIGHAGSLSPHRLALIAAGTSVYAALFVLEGVGLVMRKRWGEIVTVVITGSFIPWEIYEAIHRASLAKFALIALNVAIVGYLLWRLRHKE